MESLPPSALKAKQPHYRRIADGLRGQILRGKWGPGAQLPSTDKLAVTWQASYGTIHSALQSLVKEGWIERVDGSGTFVAEFKNRFTCAGIYHGIDIFSKDEHAFSRALHGSLLKQLNSVDKEAQVFIDTRPKSKQGKVLPELTEAILHRRIQCVIAHAIDAVDDAPLIRLPVPTAFLSISTFPNRVHFDWENLFRESMRSLVTQGCRSVGMICNIFRFKRENDSFRTFYPLFHQAVQDAGMVTREEWVLSPPAAFNYPLRGYSDFRRLWQLTEKPDALIVYPDRLVNSAIIAILETGMQLVTKQMKFVFHRNAHINFLCPFPVTWAISNEDLVAKELVCMIERQFAGEKITPVLIPYEFHVGTSGI